MQSLQGCFGAALLLWALASTAATGQEVNDSSRAAGATEPGGASVRQPTSNVPPPLPSAAASASTVPIVALKPEHQGGSEASSKPESEKAADPWARGAAAIGIALTLLNIGIAWRKAKRDRRISVEEDFWFRKILTPSTIEPILEGMVSLLETLPVRQTVQSDQAAYALRVTTEFQKFGVLVQALALYHVDLPQEILVKLRVCEDTLTDYCESLTKPAPPSGDADANLLRANLWSQLSAAMQVIKARQLAHK